MRGNHLRLVEVLLVLWGSVHAPALRRSTANPLLSQLRALLRLRRLRSSLHAVRVGTALGVRWPTAGEMRDVLLRALELFDLLGEAEAYAGSSTGSTEVARV